MGAAAQSKSFSQLDTDRNGWLDRNEARTSTDVESNWSSMDKDGNDRVSRQEFASAYGTVTPRQDRN
jgi:hypothetical protein